MSTDNVTPIRGGNEQPPRSPAKTRRPRKRPEEEIGLKFASGKDSSAFRAFLGLKGVCHALYALEGNDENLDEFMRLSAAASLLVDILEELQTS